MSYACRYCQAMMIETFTPCGTDPVYECQSPWCMWTIYAPLAAELCQPFTNDEAFDDMVDYLLEQYEVSDFDIEDTYVKSSNEAIEDMFQDDLDRLIYQKLDSLRIRKTIHHPAIKDRLDNYQFPRVSAYKRLGATQ